jgi:hypothetical protein
MDLKRAVADFSVFLKPKEKEIRICGGSGCAGNFLTK